MNKIFGIIFLFIIFLTNAAFSAELKKTDYSVLSSSSFNFEELNRIPLKLKIISEISTKDNLIEGQKLIFLTTENVVLSHKKVLPAGSRVLGVVETISDREKSGVPANLIIGNFKIEYIPSAKISGRIVLSGTDRTDLVRMFKPFLFAVKGGHAKISSDGTFVVWYIPQDI